MTTLLHFYKRDSEGEAIIFMVELVVSETNTVKLDDKK